MQRSKSLALMFLLGAVLVGGVLGFTADRVITGSREKDSRTSLYEQLELTEAQRASFDSILDDRHRKFSEALKPIRPQMDSIRENARDAMRAVMNPEQRERYETILDNQRRKNEQRREESNK